MQEMLEIREICKTPKQLLKSQSFERYLELYKNEFITELKKREDKDLKEELQHRITFIEDINAVDIKLNGRINPDTILLKAVR